MRRLRRPHLSLRAPLQLADRQDNWRFDYRQSFAYQDANYGCDCRHVQQDDHNYYFREGIQRGYDDG